MDRRLVAALKALTDVTRLRIVVELAGHDASVEELAGRVGVAPSAAARHLRRLRSAGIVEASGRWPDARYRLRPERLGELGRALDEAGRDAAEPQPGLEAPAGRELDADEARVLSGFFDEDGRLTTIPAHSSKRVVVLRYLRDRCFPEDRAYPEKEVNQRLAVVHPDAASLRRYLVDAGLMRRAAGIYHRAE